MSEEPNATPEPTGTPTEPMAQISEAELETLRTRSSQFDKIEEEAKAVGFSDVEEYQDFLVTKKADELDQGQPNQPQPVVDPILAPKTVTQPDAGMQQLNAKIDALSQRFDTSVKDNEQSKTIVSTVYLESQYTQRQMDQNALPEEQRSANTKTELYDLIRGPMGVMVREQAKKSGGNLCTAADQILNVQKGLEAQERGNAPTPAATVAATQIGQGVPPKPEPKAGARSPNDEAADDICPDEDFVLQT